MPISTFSTMSTQNETTQDDDALPPRSPTFSSQQPQPLNDPGIPPRAPRATEQSSQHNSNPGTTPSVAHRNGKSHHERRVSWDQAPKVDKHPSPKLSPRENPDTTTPLLPMSSRPPPLSLRAGTGGSQRQISATLASMPTDVYEREADDILMRALDERDPLRSRADTGGSVLSGLPLDQLNHDFAPPDNEGMTSTSRTPPRQRLFSHDSNQNEHPQPTHRRQLTVEQALFGLTEALNAIQTEETADLVTPAVTDEQLPNRERLDTGTSADRLAATADHMFQRYRKKPEESKPDSDHEMSDIEGASGIESTSLPSDSERRRWNLLGGANTENYKKTDNPHHNQSEMPDIEEDAELSGNLMDFEIHVEGTVEGQGCEDDEYGKDGQAKFNPFRHLPYAGHIKNEWELFNNFLKPRTATIVSYFRYIVLYLWIPSLGVAALLFHIFDNPPTGVGPMEPTNSTAHGQDITLLHQSVEGRKASVSWWLIFACIREVSLVVIARTMEAIVVDFLALQTKASLRAFGPVITLFLVQSKGWPFLVTTWGILNFAFVTGNSDFNHHWLYWQDFWGLFNANNPSGDVTNSLWFKRVCAVAVSVGILVSLKRVAVGILLGRQTFANYSEPLAKVMNKMLQVSQVARLAQDNERKALADLAKKVEPQLTPSTRGPSNENLMSLIENASIEDSPSVQLAMSFSSDEGDTERIVDPNDLDPYTGGLGYAQRARIADLLGRWEEPGRGHTQVENITVASVLQFRRALAHMDTAYPFSAAFGIADTRDACVISAQQVYERLFRHSAATIDNRVHFDTLAVLAIQKDGELDSEKAKELIRTFRPERDGGISLIDFVRSVDSIYKELRMLRATISSSTKIDKAVETILNCIFYIVITSIILSETGFDPLALFLSLSSIILAFAFMIGSASSKYFEGLLFILIQRPYGIGDRINVSNPESDSNGTGAQGWIVDDLTLFTTTVYMGGTNERATISNGNLAKSRIINGARSPQAIIVLSLRFGVETPHNRIEVFKSAVEKFVKARPREWLALVAIRASTISADLGFVEYSVVVQHRESWQSITQILDSKHAIQCFILELTKKLGIQYKSPPLPVLMQTGQSLSSLETQYDFQGTTETSAKPQGGRQISDVDRLISLFGSNNQDGIASA